MHWTYCVLLGTAILGAHFGGSFAGTLAVEHDWSESNSNAVMVTAIGIPYLIAMTALLLLEFRPPRGTDRQPVPKSNRERASLASSAA